MKSSNSRVVCAIAKRFYGFQAAERVSGKTVLITGASSGIGRATAYELAKASQGTVRLILSARRLDRLQKIDSDLRHQFPQIKILPFQLDVANHLSVPKELSKIPDEWAKLDVLINNA
jgi:3-hydroxy acid dehydrogenase/malonic semialdehyde reductase